MYDRPRTLFIAGFVGNPPMNLRSAEVLRQKGSFRARSKDLDIAVSAERGAKAAGRGEVLLGIRAEDITIVDRGTAGEVYILEPMGRDDLLTVRIGGVDIHVLADPGLKHKMGDTVHLQFNPDKVQFFDMPTERSLLWD